MCRMHVGATGSGRHCSRHSHTWSQEQVPAKHGAKTTQIADLDGANSRQRQSVFGSRFALEIQRLWYSTTSA
jgi:hypothetical protein